MGTPKDYPPSFHCMRWGALIDSNQHETGDFLGGVLLYIFIIRKCVTFLGWNHRGVYILSRSNKLENKIKRRLSPAAHRRMRMDYHRSVDTTSCDPEETFNREDIFERWHPHRGINPKSYRAPVHPYISRGHRRNLKVLD